MPKPDSPFGPTGKHPLGKLDPTDEGELQFGIATDAGNVIMRFDTPVTWIGFPAQQAVDLARLLLKHARVAAREAGQPLKIELDL